jgi:hypothetical protein
MLSPRYLDGLADELTEIYSQLETDILQDMARRIERLGKVTDATKWQAQMLSEAGAMKKNIARILAKYDKKIVQQITDTVTNALETSARNDNRIFKAATGRTVSANNAQAMLLTIQKCHSDLSRLTLTTAATSETQFVQEANRVYMMTQSGAFDYDTAMKSAADKLSERGITTVQYENGKPVTRSIESAVRMNILTSINQSAANQTLNNAEELGVEKFEVSAHIGARPEHEAWQGKVYTKADLYKVCNLGSVTGLCGINCRHSFYPYFDGMDKHYSTDDLDEMASEEVEYNGKKISRYEGEQKLRNIERNIRRYKRKVLTQQAAGVDDTQARRKIGEWQAAARDFTKQTGISRDSNREYIGTSGEQPRGITPTVAGYVDNLHKAEEIKRLDNARNKIIANVPQSEPMSFQQADGGAPNPNYKKGGGYTTNCQTCVVAYEMRRRGFNVEALPKYKGSMLDVLSGNTSLAWIDRSTGETPAYIEPHASTVKKALAFLQSDTIKKNNRYTIEFVWKSSRHAGHIIHFWKNTKDVLYLYDPQTGENIKGNELIFTYLKETHPTTIKLLDVQNCDINLNVVNKILKGVRK